MAEKETTRTDRALAYLRRQYGKPWFWPAVASFPSLDYLVPVLPNQMVMIGLAAAEPGRWRTVAAVFVLGSAFGAWATAHLVGLVGPSILPAGAGGETWATVSGLIERHGVWMLGVLALSPFPPRLAVFACAAAGLAPELIAASVAAGRTVPATLICYLSARSPAFLAWLSRRMPRLSRG